MLAIIYLFLLVFLLIIFILFTAIGLTFKLTVQSLEEKTRLIDKIRGKKGVKTEDKVEPEEWMTTREKLHWGLEAFKSLKKPLYNLFSDLLHGIKTVSYTHLTL